MKNKICMVAPYRELAELTNQINRQRRLSVDIVVGNLEYGGELALRAEREGAQVIVSRGGTASIIRRLVHIPVVEIQVTGYDVLRAIQPLVGTRRTAGIVGFQNVVNGCRAACEILGISIREFILPLNTDVDWTALRLQLRQAIDEEGVDILIGDTVASTNKDKLGMDVRLITSGEESILWAIEEASRIVQVLEDEQKTAQRFQAVLNFVHDGVVATDEDGMVTVLNPAAEQTFRITREKALGHHVTSILKNNCIEKVLKSGRAKVGQIQKVAAGYILANHIPIQVGGSTKGVVATFQEVTQIQDAERVIRQSLYGKGLVTKYTFEDILTNDPQMKKLVEVAKGYALTGATVLIQGESGTGKELFAQSLHASSPRARGPFVAINCAALPPQLLESELFGYVEGAFTGAKKGGKIGLFELAHKGTIFLDEISDMDKGLQARLLRILEERRVMPLGSDTLIPVDIRIIAATNTDLRKQVSQGDFRMDLYYRINALNLPIIPLRERKSDIPLLVSHFLDRFGREHSRDISEFPVEVVRLLERYIWPGNVRELKNIVERIVLSAEKGKVHLPTVQLMVDELWANQTRETGRDDVAEILTGTFQDIKRRIVRRVLKEEDWNKSRTARRLGIDRATVDRFGD
ncbi:MAG: proprionate catabolism activator, Fis family [Paenibacillus sp.]|nr:proprionate catabolism activator, Fis family [Paenibacillus sp.]